MKKLAVLVAAAFFAFLLQISAGLEARSQDPATARQLKAGQRVYRLHCQSCHGREGDHPDKAFNLADKEWKHGASLGDIEKTVKKGVKGTAMLGFERRLTAKQIASVTRYVYSFQEESDKK
ncbi:MAG: c-type cytochrome [Acidobacteriota bacterium]